MASRSDMWMLTSTVRSSSLASIMRTGIVGQRPRRQVRGGLGLQQFGVAGVRQAGGGQRLLVQRRGDQGGDLAAQRGARGPHHASAATRPASALMRPVATSGTRRATCSTGMQRGGTVGGFGDDSMTRSAPAGPAPGAASARARGACVATSPATKQPRVSRAPRGRPWR
jgi:hypothetical protein